MKIVDIAAGQLYSFVYKRENGIYEENEYDRLLDLWTDVSYLRAYAKNNKVKDINQFVNNRLEGAEQIEDVLEEIVNNEQPLEYYFTLYDTEMGVRILSLQKGKASRKNGLRL